MDTVLSQEEPVALPTRSSAGRVSLAWPVCGRVVDVSGGPGGRALRCHLSHGHRGECDDLGSSELEHWQARANAADTSRSRDDVIAIALAHARSYEAVAQWRRERGARYEAERLDSMAEALHHFIGILKR